MDYSLKIKTIKFITIVVLYDGICIYINMLLHGTVTSDRDVPIRED